MIKVWKLSTNLGLLSWRFHSLHVRSFIPLATRVHPSVTNYHHCEASEGLLLEVTTAYATDWPHAKRMCSVFTSRRMEIHLVWKRCGPKRNGQNCERKWPMAPFINRNQLHHTFETWGVIAQPRPYYRGSLVKSPLKVWNGWIITENKRIWLLIHI